MSFGAVAAKRSTKCRPPSRLMFSQERLSARSKSVELGVSPKMLTLQLLSLLQRLVDVLLRDALGGELLAQLAGDVLQLGRRPRRRLRGVGAVRAVEDDGRGDLRGVARRIQVEEPGLRQQRRQREVDDADGEVEPERRDVGLVPAGDELARQLAGPAQQQLERPPHAAVEVQQRMRDVARDLLHREHVGVRGLAALRAVTAFDDGAAVEAARRLLRRRRELVPRLEHAPLALDPAAEALRGLGAQPRRVVLQVMVERRGALHAVADAAALPLAGRRLGHLDAGAVEARAGEHVADVARQPGVVIGDDVRVELALDFVDEARGHVAAPRGDSGS